MGKIMKNILQKLGRDEQGQAFILVLIFLLVGGLITGPLLGYMSTGLLAGQMYEAKMDELYAADAGVEDALWKIINDDASLQALEVGEESDPYYLTVNDLSVSYTVTKLALVQGLIDDSDYKEDQPHEDWIDFATPMTSEQTGTYVKYSCEITFYYDGGGNRRVQIMGVFFSPRPNDAILIEGPDEITYTPVFTDVNLENITTERVSGGFTFIWRWQNNQGPRFDQNNRDGALSFTFKVYDPLWEPLIYFGFATFKEQDISYVTNAPGSYNWLIEATAENTGARSAVLYHAGLLNVLTWEINP